MTSTTSIATDFGSSTFTPIVLLFTERYGKVPSTYGGTYYFDLKALLKFLNKKYPQCMQDSCIEYVRDKSGSARLNSGMLFLTNGIAVAFDVQHGEIETEFAESYYHEDFKPEVKAEQEHFKTKVIICFDPSSTTLEKVENVMSQILKHKVEPKKKSELHFLCVENGDLTLKSLDLKSPVLDISLNYGKSFKELHDYVYDRLVGAENKNKGLVLLYGTPGTGKTFYIRHLISLLSDKKRVIYVPPDMVGELSSPKFLPFLMEYPESILIVEDGENVIKSRKGGQNQAVSNLLNAADGLLSDALNVQIICTFNCKLTDVDEALLRKGRLIGKHEFKALSIEDAQNVLKHLKIDFKATEPMTLADIYNCQEKTFTEDRPALGFGKKE